MHACLYWLKELHIHVRKTPFVHHCTSLKNCIVFLASHLGSWSTAHSENCAIFISSLRASKHPAQIISYARISSRWASRLYVFFSRSLPKTISSSPKKLRSFCYQSPSAACSVSLKKLRRSSLHLSQISQKVTLNQDFPSQSPSDLYTIFMNSAQSPYPSLKYAFRGFRALSPPLVTYIRKWTTMHRVLLSWVIVDICTWMRHDAMTNMMNKEHMQGYCFMNGRTRNACKEIFSWMDEHMKHAKV